jgi:dienelactone hydrolase
MSDPAADATGGPEAATPPASPATPVTPTANPAAGAVPTTNPTTAGAAPAENSAAAGTAPTENSTAAGTVPTENSTAAGTAPTINSAAAGTAPTASGSASPTTDPAAVAATVLELLLDGAFADLHRLLAPQVQGMISADGLRAAWVGETGALGGFAGSSGPVVEPSGSGGAVVRTVVAFDGGARALIVTVTPDGRLGGLQLAPAEAAAPIAPWEPPGYADPEQFTEEEVLGGHGTLAVPRRNPPWAAVVLLPGSGPHDRDGTLGRNKPLKDIAWGLATRGIAVLRFDKVTYGARADGARHPEFTLTDEYVPDAVAAIELLRGRDDVHEIYVLGHSLGGTVAPRVATAEPAVAGLILVSAGAVPMHRATLRQVRYLAGLSPGTPEDTVDALARQVAAVDSPDLSPTTPASELPFGVPAPYWLDVRDYDAPALAATLDRPILIVQGGRDYQATVADDLARWRAALAGHDDVTVRVYEADNHLLFTGTGPSGPAEYEPAQHVDPQVVADIAEWIGQQAQADAPGRPDSKGRAQGRR